MIKTHSVYIIQCVPNRLCFIVQEGDGPLMQEDTEGKLYYDGHVGGWIDPEKQKG